MLNAFDRGNAIRVTISQSKSISQRSTHDVPGTATHASRIIQESIRGTAARPEHPQVRSMNLDVANRMIDAGLEKARKLGIKIAFAIVDDSGVLVALKRMEGAGAYTTAIAENQAWSAVTWQRSGED